MYYQKRRCYFCRRAAAAAQQRSGPLPTLFGCTSQSCAGVRATTKSEAKAACRQGWCSLTISKISTQ